MFYIVIKLLLGLFVCDKGGAQWAVPTLHKQHNFIKPSLFLSVKGNNPKNKPKCSEYK